MGITKSLMNTGSRAIFNRMSDLFKDSPRLQGLVAKGADLIPVLSGTGALTLVYAVLLASGLALGG